MINGATGRSINATESGTYSVEVVTGPEGCPSVASANTVVLTFQPAPAKPVISQVGNTLQADVQADQYQWRDANGNAIPLAVNPTYNPPHSGRYSLTVRNANGCEATSDPITFTLGTSRGAGLAAGVRLWPNPVVAGQVLRLESTVGERFGSEAFDLVDLSGRQHPVTAVERATGWELHTAHLPVGLYFIRNAGTVLGQVVVQAE